MNPAWDYFWPAFILGLLVGGLTGTLGFRRRSRRKAALAGGVFISIILAALWHGPFGAADRFATQVERNVRATIVYNLIPQVQSRIARGPLTRRIILSGPADDFQRSQLVLIIGDLPGVSSATWSADHRGVPLIVEGAAVAVLGFLFGLLLAYLVELRRRYNLQWNW